MTNQEMKSIVEGALFAAGEAVSIDKLISLFAENEKPTQQEMRDIVIKLAEELHDRAVEIVETASGFRLQVRATFAPWVSRLWEDKIPRYSRASLETLALIAYRQPITRGQIEEIRGVAVNPNIIKTFLEREWVRVVGHKEVPGHPELLATTKNFLDDFNLKSLSELPTLSELKDLDRLEHSVQLSLQLEPTAMTAQVETAAELPSPENHEENHEEISDSPEVEAVASSSLLAREESVEHNFEETS